MRAESGAGRFIYGIEAARGGSCFPLAARPYLCPFRRVYRIARVAVNPSRPVQVREQEGQKFSLDQVDLQQCNP